MRAVVTSIPDRSHGIRVWLNLKDGTGLPADKDPYDFACNLIHIDDETCEVSQAIGKMTRRVAYAIGRKAKELGYKKLIYCRADSHVHNRWGSHTGSKDHLDYYEVDLNEH